MILPTPLPIAEFLGVHEPQSFGTPQSPLVAAPRRLLNQILRYSDEDRRRERGGFLLGRLYDDQGDYIGLEAFVPAVQAAGDSGSLRFTHAAWSALHREMEQHYPDLLIVGWQHTHPSYGIFLSQHDLFIQRHFFREPYQVAMVVDPVRQEFGFFHWREGEIIDCGFCTD